MPRAKYKTVLVDKAGSSPQLQRGELADATLNDVVIELGRPGTSSFTLNTGDTKAALVQLIDREAQIWRDDELLWWGGIWTRDGNAVNHTFQLEGIFAYLFRRNVKATQTFTNVDQLNIAWSLIDYAQAQPRGELGITASSFIASGVTRTREYPADEHGNIGELVTAFTQLESGFDFDVVVDGSGSRQWTPYYPSKGSLKSALVLEWKRNILDYSYVENAKVMATNVLGTGSGEGDAKLTSDQEDVDLSEEHLLLTEVTQFQNVQEQATLDEHTAKALAVSSRVPKVVTVRVEAEYWLQVETGDRVPVRIDHGATQVSGTYRIYKMVIRPADDTAWLSLMEV